MGRMSRPVGCQEGRLCSIEMHHSHLRKTAPRRTNDGDMGRIAEADRVRADADNRAILLVKLVERRNNGTKELDPRPPKIGERREKGPRDVRESLISDVENKDAVGGGKCQAQGEGVQG